MCPAPHQAALIFNSLMISTGSKEKCSGGQKQQQEGGEEPELMRQTLGALLRHSGDRCIHYQDHRGPWRPVPTNYGRSSLRVFRY